MREATAVEKASIPYIYPASASATREFLQSGREIRFPPAADQDTRTVEASEIESLAKRFSGGFAQPIRISNAIIKGALRLDYITFEREVIITDSEFTGRVDFSFASFQGAAHFRGCYFLQTITFRGCYVRGDLEFDLARFAGEADFRQTAISKNLRARGAEFDRVRFDGAEIKGDAAFTSWDDRRVTRFRGSADFSSAHITGQADFRSASFESDLICDLIQIDGGAFFASDDLRVEGHEAQTAGSSIIQQTVFGGKVRFVGASISRQADFSGAIFHGAAEFDGITVDGDLQFGFDENTKYAVVEGEMRFPGSHIRGQAVFTGATLAGKTVFTQCWIEQEALFGAVCFGDDVSFEGARFDGLTCFRRREHEGAHARFLKSAKFDSAVFSVKADFSSVTFEDIVSFNSSHFSSDAIFRGVLFNRDASFVAVQSDTDMDFRDAIFARRLSLREASTKAAFFRESSLETEPPRISPQFLGDVDLSGFTYQRIYVAWKEMVRKIEPFDKQPYAQLEVGLRTIGEDRSADDVYLSQRMRKLTHNLKNFRTNSARAILDLLYFVIANFGVRPYILLIWLGVFLSTGMWLFSLPGALIPKKDSQNSAHQLSLVEACAVSINSLLPIEVPIGSGWRPSDKPTPLPAIPVLNIPITFEGYASLSRLAGWILIPIGVAWITGVIRRKP